MSRARLLDLILADRMRPPHWWRYDSVEDRDKWDGLRDRIIEQASVATLLVADNVAEYIYAGTDKEQWDKEDFPNAAPPWPEFFIEYRRPSKINSLGKTTSSNGVPFLSGVLFKAEEVDTRSGTFGGMTAEEAEAKFNDGLRALPPGIVEKANEVAMEWARSGKKLTDFMEIKDLNVRAFFMLLASREALKNDPSAIKPPPGAKWILSCLGFVQMDRNDQVIAPAMSWMVIVNADGSVMESQTIVVSPVGHEIPRYISDTASDAGFFINPALLALSFLHSKNVSVREEAPPESQQSAWLRKNKRRLLKYKVLEIRPFYEVVQGLKKSGASNALGQALHICRGHFKDYGSKGLFGKYKGLFWWNQFVRGSVEHGVVEKDYSIGNVKDRE